MSSRFINRRVIGVAAAGLAASAGLLAISPAAIASVPATTAKFSVSTADPCTVSFFGTQTLTFTYTGVAPTTAVAGAKVKITKGVLKVSVPASLATAAASLGVASGQGMVTTEGLTSVKPASYNVILKPPYATAIVTVKSGKPIVLTIPKSGTFSDGTYTAGAKGSTLTVDVGAFDGTFSGFDSSGDAVFSDQPITCAAPTKAVPLVSIPVS
jgi:hypothetical protein